jgi:hypothetical protein
VRVARANDIAGVFFCACVMRVADVRCRAGRPSACEGYVQGRGTVGHRVGAWARDGTRGVSTADARDWEW